MATPVIGLPELEAAQGQKYLTVNQTFRRLDVLVNLTVFNRTVTTPPGAPSEGHRYIVGSPATGGFTGQENNIAAFIGAAWVFFTPSEGWRAYDQGANQFVIFDGSAWVLAGLSSSALSDGSVNLLGVGATPDATNRLSVTSPGVLFNRETDDFTLTMNKNAAGDDLQILMQTGFSTRVQMGLLTNDDFIIKVSPDGSSFFDSITVDKDTGNVAIGAGSDANNKLLVSGESMLFTNSGDLRFTFNKGASGNDVALTFQSGFSARALIGLLGDDNFTFKVTPDASNFYTSFVLNKDNGQISFEALMGAKRAFPTIAANTLAAESSFVNPSNGGTVNTISGGFDGAILIVQPTGGSITFTNSDNIKTPGATNLVLADWNDAAMFVCNGGGTWLCVSVSQN